MQKRIFLIFILILFSTSCSSSQFKSITSSNVDEYLKKTPGSTDYPDAEVCLLHSYVYEEFYEDGTSVTRHVERYKIFNERGRKYATKTISYREGYQKASILFANTIKTNGQVVPLSSRDVFEGAQYAGLEFYTDIKFIRFTMPAVENNCIVEYAYEIKNIKPSLRFDYSTVFLCRNFYPMEEDILEVVVPVNQTLNFKSYNTTLAPKIILEERKKRYIFNNIKQKALVPEPRMPALMDRETFPQVWLWTLKDWKGISSWYIKIVQEQMTSDQELEDFTRSLVSDKKTKEEKISAIFNFVSQNIRYIAVLLGPHTHKPHAAFEVFKKRYGDCKDKTVLLLTMLKIAGIEGFPVLVPARRDYFDETMPSLGAFNHVIAAVPNGHEFYWLDATNEVAAYNAPPFNKPSKVFLMYKDGSYQFFMTPGPDEQKDYSKAILSFNLDREGNALVNYQYTFFGKAAETVRYVYKYLSPEQRKRFFEKKGIEVTDLKFGSFSDTESPFFITISGKLKNLAQVVDNNTMILSNFVSVDAYRDITAASKRLYPIVLLPSFYSREIFHYILPEGFSAKSVPQTFLNQKRYQTRREMFTMKDNVFEVHVESVNRPDKIPGTHIEQFKQDAIILQKHETALKNIILERKQ